MAKVQFSKAPQNIKTHKQFRPWLSENLYFGFCCYTWLPCQNSLSIDHYMPKEHFPNYATDPKNLLLCTSASNSAKGDYHPKAQRRRCFQKSHHDVYNCRCEDIGCLVYLEPAGKVKIRKDVERFRFNEKMFKFNHPDIIQIRAEALSLLKALCFVYKQQKNASSTSTHPYSTMPVHSQRQKPVSTGTQSVPASDSPAPNRQRQSKLAGSNLQLNELLDMCAKRYVLYHVFNIEIEDPIKQLILKQRKKLQALSGAAVC